MTDWKPQLYRYAADELGISKAVLEAAVSVSEAVVAVHPSLPPILTLKHLSYLCGVSYRDLRDFVSRDDEDPYKVFRISKRPHPKGGEDSESFVYRIPSSVSFRRGLHGTYSSTGGYITQVQHLRLVRT